MIKRYARPKMIQLWSDETRFNRWLEVELLVAEAWEHRGQFPAGTAERLRKSASVTPQRVEALESAYRHDMIAFTAAVTETVDPDDARAIHFGLTSTDVVDTALASILVEALDEILAGLGLVRQRLRHLALQYRDTPIMGRTHGMHAEPTSFGLKMALFWLEFGRAATRLERARAQMAVGKISGAVGHYANVPPDVEEYVCRGLKLLPAPLSTQVLQRDRHAEVILALALMATSVDKLTTELRHLQRTEVGEVEEPFSRDQRGSSAMPHKRNPVSCEQLSGLARVMRGFVIPALEDVPLWHERDISHSSVERIMLPDATILADYMLHTLSRILEGLTVKPARMRANIDRTGGLPFSQRVMLALVESGLSRDEAYRRVQTAAMQAMESPAASFKERLWNEPTIRERFTPATWEALFDLTPYLKYVETIYHRIGIMAEEGMNDDEGHDAL